jgi:signal transduction histidine kinase
VHDPRIAWNDRAPGSDPLRLTRALTQDLRASLHGLRLALDMMAGVLQGGEAGPVGRFLGMARTEAAQLDRLVEQLGLWIRLMGGDYRVHLQRLDLGALLTERCAGTTDTSVEVLADKGLMVPALDGLLDFLKAYALPEERSGIRLHAGGLVLFGPDSLLPVLQTVVDDPVPDLQAAKGPAMWLVGPALAVAACRSSGGRVWLKQEQSGCSLWLIFQPA